ncbi:MAG TPA: hypothetical protein VMT62_05145 [Syntrophorhabdaceae bacterium]|nr:hypothetical protein [Syntrophorhabdaceae bacterium]
MRKCSIGCLSLILLILCSCSAGPVYIAKNESQAIKHVYSDPSLQKLYEANVDLLGDIYVRYSASHVAIVPDGIGFTPLNDQNNQRLQYLAVNVRPSELYFDGSSTKAENRFSYALQQVPRYMKLIKSKDLDREGVQGLAFGLYWPVRDFSQCQEYGGYIEYLQVYLEKGDAQDVLDGRRDYIDALTNAEVITSLGLQPARNVRPVF